MDHEGAREGPEGVGSGYGAGHRGQGSWPRFLQHQGQVWRQCATQGPEGHPAKRGEERGRWPERE